MAMTTGIPQAVKRLPAMQPDVTKMKTVVALCQAVLGSISFNLYNYVIECGQIENFWSFFISCLHK
jgi:hypothetical protein